MTLELEMTLISGMGVMTPAVSLQSPSPGRIGMADLVLG
jgi:hypothetical protein